MTSIWHRTQQGWARLGTTSYQNEQELHDMVQRSPELLPLSGAPRLVIIGREVVLRGAGRVDVLAVEPDGRPVIIEVKLSDNAEARRSVVSQALSYAAALYRMTREEFEASLAPYLHGGSLHSVVVEHLQGQSLDEVGFNESLERHLAEGSFRAVIVLNEAPAELVTLMGFLEAKTDDLTLDLVTISSYRVGEDLVAVPQRIDPARPPEQRLPGRAAAQSAGYTQPGVDPFRAEIARAPEPHRAVLEGLATWTEDLHRAGLVKAVTYFGVSGDVTLLPRLAHDPVGLVSVWFYSNGQPAISFWRSVFERYAPQFIEQVEALIAPKTVGVGTQTRVITDELLGVLREAYVAAAQSGRTIRETR